MGLILRTVAEVREYFAALDKKDFAFDTETASWYGSALNMQHAQLVGISFCDGARNPAFLPVKFHSTHEALEADPNGGRKKLRVTHEYRSAFGLDWEEVKPLVVELFDGAGCTCHNGKYDGKVAQKYGFYNYRLVHDTMLMSFCLDCTTRNGLKESALRELGVVMTTFEEAAGQKVNNIDWSKVDMQQMAEYACDDAEQTYALREHFKPMIEQRELQSVYYKLEMPVVPVLVEMESRGVRVLPNLLHSLAAQMEGELHRHENTIYKLAGVQFNINSGKQLGEVLFDRLGLPVIKQTKGGDRSTDAGTLKELAYQGYDIADALLEQSKLSTLLNTYAKGIPKLLDPEGTLRGGFNQMGTETGRFSSSEPNLQNQPNNEDYPIRSAFVPRPGYGFIVTDWSAIEMRVMAHESGDPTLIRIFTEGRDPHQETTDGINASVPGLNIKRSQGKIANFAILYGMGPDSLQETLNAALKSEVRKGKITEAEYQAQRVTRKMAEDIISGFDKAYPVFAQWRDHVVQQAKTRGYVRTFTGRFRPIEEFNRKTKEGVPYMGKGDFGYGSRKAVNTKIQGGAGDLMKRNMVRLTDLFRNQGYDAHLLLVVHDEFVIECRLDQIHRCAKEVEVCMETVWPNCKVPIAAEVECLTAWSGMKGHSGYIREKSFVEQVLTGLLPSSLLS